MQTIEETVTILDTLAGHVVVVRDSLSGWRVIEDGFTQDRSYAAIRAAGIDGARVLPAVQERQEVGGAGKDSRTRTVLLVDWQALNLAARRNDLWYAVRVAPGTQRVAKLMPDAPEHRKAETIIERNLREANIDVYMPAFWRDVRTHRGHKVRPKRFPLLVGYSFIRRDPSVGFHAIRKIDGVIDVVSVKQSPAAISEDDIRFLMVEMFKREQEYRFQKAHAAEAARFNRRNKLNAELGRHLPKGRERRRTSLRAYADQCIHSMPEAARRRIMGIISALDGLDADEALDDFREPV